MILLEDHAKSLFLAALERAPDQWPAFLNESCGDNAELRARVDQLLQAHQAMGSIHGGRAEAPAATLAERLTEQPGTVIGPYKLLEQIGEGGFGVVFMAEQQHPVRRKVALKVLKPGMDTRQVIARFEAERQALALMDHPHIAHVFDGGETASGRPYFVMELVRGIPITDFCDQNHIGVRERLELYISVCQAVQHAHQRGIIHRDLKPSNVLVTLHDDKPVVKVIDFGIAKATGQQLTEKTLFTNFAQMIGTPLYMSPEQARLSGLDIDTRSDIYSLGVLLYELLTGTTPFDKERLRTAAYDEILRIIREEEPAKPSTRISTLGKAAITVSANRHSDPRRLAQLCRGELDWIVMKALEKDRNRRYESASAFAADVQRYLKDEPVQACPPSAWYRFRKFARRNKRVVVMACFLFALVVLAVAVLGVSYAQVTRALNSEQEALQDKTRALESERQTFYFHSIELAHRELTGNRPDPDRAEKLLDACPRRGWEWHYLKRLWRVEPVVLRPPGNEEINSVAFSPDGKQLAAACGDGSVKVWHLGTGQVDALSGHKESVFSVAFSPTDGRRLASASADKTVRVWDLPTQKEVFPALPGQGGSRLGTATVTFSPDGRWLAAASEGGTVRIWDAETGRQIQELPGHELRTGCLAFSRDGRLLASGSMRGKVRIWDAETGRSRFELVESTHPVSALAFSPDGQSLAAGSFDPFTKVWDTTTGKLLYTLPEFSDNGLAFSPDGERLASAGRDRTVRLWHLPAQQEILRLRGHTDRCQGLAFSPDGGLLVSASRDGTIRFWDATPLTGNEGQEVLTFYEHTHREHTHVVMSVAISPDGKRIASAGQDGIVFVWDATSGQVTQTHSEITTVVFSLAFSPDGRYLAATGVDDDEARPSVLRVWDARTGQPVAPPLRYVHQVILAVAFSPNGRWLALGLEDGTVKLVDARTGQEIGVGDKRHREVPEGGIVAFRPDGRHLASVGSEGTVVVRDVTLAYQSLPGWRPWFALLALCSQGVGSAPLPLAAAVKLAVWSETSRPHPVFTLRCPDHPLASVAYSPDGQRLITASADGQLTLWESETGIQIRTVPGPFGGEHYPGENYAVFSPDGRWVVAASADCTARVWDAMTLELIETFRGHRANIRCLAVSPDGKFLVTGSADKTVKVWDLTHLAVRKSVAH